MTNQPRVLRAVLVALLAASAFYLPVLGHALATGGVSADDWRLWVFPHGWILVLGCVQAMAVVGLFWLLKRRFAHMERRALHDPLTELPNRSYVEMYLNWVCPRAEVHGEVVILAFIDLNGFKTINDDYGHDRGDDVLKELSRRLRRHCRSGDVASRFGGDEFVVVFVTAANHHGTAVERLKCLLHDVFDDACGLESTLAVGAAIGISTFPVRANSPSMLLREADQAMYRAKRISRQSHERIVVVETAARSSVAPGQAIDGGLQGSRMPA